MISWARTLITSRYPRLAWSSEPVLVRKANVNAAQALGNIVDAQAFGFLGLNHVDLESVEYRS